jgi:hypothetical protein
MIDCIAYKQIVYMCLLMLMMKLMPRMSDE